MRFRLPSLSNLLRHLPANFLAPPRPGSAGEQYLTHEKVRASLGYFGNQVRFLPWIDGSVVDETTEMRESYRQMLREPAIKAAFFKKILCIAQLDLQVHPASDSAIDQEVAAFVSDALNGCRGGIRRIVYSILSGAVMDGYSVCEKVWQVQDRGRWKGRVTLKALKSKDSRWLELIGDTYRNVTHVRDLRTSYSYAAENFVIYAHLPMFETPLGMSDFRAAYRAYWIMDAAWKLRSILLERYTLPFLMGSYPMARKDLRPALEASLETARAQGWVSLPEGAKIEAIQLATKGESDFKSAIQDLTSEMVLAIEGATLQTLQGTVSDGRGNSLVHQDSSQILTGFLAAEVADVLSSQLVPSLVDINVAGAAYPRVTLSSVDDGALLQSLQVDEGLQKLGLPLSKKAAYEKYSRQKPTDPEDALNGQEEGPTSDAAGVPGPSGAEARLSSDVEPLQRFADALHFSGHAMPPRAPVGGATINGRPYAGGEFIPWLEQGPPSKPTSALPEGGSPHAPDGSHGASVGGQGRERSHETDPDASIHGNPEIGDPKLEAAIRDWWDTLPRQTRHQLNQQLAETQSPGIQGITLVEAYRGSQKAAEQYSRDREQWEAEAQANQAKADQRYARLQAQAEQIRFRHSPAHVADLKKQLAEADDASRSARFWWGSLADIVSSDIQDKRAHLRSQIEEAEAALSPEEREALEQFDQAKRISSLSLTEKFKEVLTRALPKLAPEMQERVKELISELPAFGAVLGAWGIGHYLGYGWAIDAALAAIGYALLGTEVLQVSKDLYLFAATAAGARTAQDLDRAAEHFARGISKIAADTAQAGAAAGVKRLGKVADALGELHVGTPPPGTTPEGKTFITAAVLRAMQRKLRGMMGRVGRIAYGNSDLSKVAIEFRQTEGISAGRNVAVFEYIDAKGVVQTIARASEGQHAERRIWSELERLGIKPEQVRRIYSELQPCDVRGGYCSAFINRTLPQALVTWSFEYGGTTASRRAGLKALQSAVKALKSTNPKNR